MRMKGSIYLAAAAVCVLGVSAISAQENSPLISTSVTDSSRFEIIQSPGDKSTTFRLDKFMGNVFRLGTCPKDDSFGSSQCWKEMIVVDLPRNGQVQRPRFQIVINTVLKMITLLQVETGQTWQYGVDPLDKWHPFIECSDRADRNCLWRP